MDDASLGLVEQPADARRSPKAGSLTFSDINVATAQSLMESPRKRRSLQLLDKPSDIAWCGLRCTHVGQQIGHSLLESAPSMHSNHGNRIMPHRQPDLSGKRWTFIWRVFPDALRWKNVGIPRFNRGRWEDPDILPRILSGTSWGWLRVDLALHRAVGCWTRGKPLQGRRYDRTHRRRDSRRHATNPHRVVASLLSGSSDRHTSSG